VILILVIVWLSFHVAATLSWIFWEPDDGAGIMAFLIVDSMIVTGCLLWWLADKIFPDHD